MQGWTAYIAASLALVLSHAALSAPGVRPWLYDRLGRAAFYTVYTAISTAALAAFVLAYVAADPGPQLFVAEAPARFVAVVLMPFAFIGVAARLSTRAQKGHALLPPQGIYRITRAPGSLATVRWAVLHMLNMGDARRLTAFAVMALIGLVALVKNEIVLARSDDPVAETWRSETTLTPMLALNGRSVLQAFRKIGWWRLAGGLAAFAAVLMLHPYAFGLDPLAGLF
ncbi:MAG TPA: NnrU family protein [Hyphomicrobiales bacterium]|nr:NnrU family protein [Hyphomicrobiales bacterium]